MADAGGPVPGGLARLCEPLRELLLVWIYRDHCTRRCRQQTLRIGEDEADPAPGWISHASPLARALFGKGIGDTATVTNGEIEHPITIRAPSCGSSVHLHLLATTEMLLFGR